MKQTYKIKYLFQFFWLVPLIALADADPLVAAGNQSLQNNKPEEAFAQYQKAEATLPNNPDLAFNKGGALYAQKKYKEAATEFLAATSSKDNKQRAEAYRHYGDALFRQQDAGAIQAYEQALSLNPEDTVAQHNLEVALSKQQEQPQSQPNQEQEQSQSQPQNQDSQSQPSSQKSQQDQQKQENQENKENQSGQENKENQEEKKAQQEQQSQQESKEEKEKKEQQAQQAQQSKEQPPNEPQDKLLDALRAKEKSFLHAKQKGKGAAQPNVSKDW